MGNTPNIASILSELKRRLGSIKRLADRIGVSDRRMRDWLKMDEEGLAHLQSDSIRRILEVARENGIHIEASPEQRLWDAARSYEDNLAARIGPPAGPRPPLWSLQKPVLGHTLSSPFGPSASVITANSDRIRFLAQTGNSVITYKSVRTRYHRSHTEPNLLFCRGEILPLDPGEIDESIYLVGSEREQGQQEYSVVNRFGVPSQPPEVWRADFRRAAASLEENQILILSVTGTASRGDPEEVLVRDFLEVVKMGVDAQAGFIELNLSCPNCSSPEGRVFEEIDLSRRICEAASGVSGGVPLIAKIGYMPKTPLEQLTAAIAPFVKGIAAINSVPVRTYRQGLDDREPAFGGNVDLRVGLSGRPILPLGLQTIENLAMIREREKFRELELLGMGGVTRPEDVQSYLDSGADAVQASTIFLWDPFFGEKVHQFLEDRHSFEENPDERLVWTARNNWNQACEMIARDIPNKEQAVMQAAVAVWMDWKKSYAISEQRWSGPKRFSAPDVEMFCRQIVRKAGLHLRHY